MMKVKKIFEEDWHGARLKAREQDCADLNAAYDALDCLDGKRRTCVVFWVNDEAVLTVGGNGEAFVVSAAYDIDGDLYTLIDARQSTGSHVNVVVGRQSGNYPSNHVVDKAMAQEAVGYFCEYGKLSPTLQWQRES
jgi:Immunity protein Imm1